MNGWDIEGRDRNFIVSEVDQFIGQRCLVEVFIACGDLAFFLSGVTVVAIILLHVTAAQDLVDALTPQAAKRMPIGFISRIGHCIATMVTLGGFGYDHTALLKTGCVYCFSCRRSSKAIHTLRRNASPCLVTVIRLPSCCTNSSSNIGASRLKIRAD